METPAAQSNTPPPMIFQDLLLELMLQNEALAKIESVNLRSLEVLNSTRNTVDDIAKNCIESDNEDTTEQRSDSALNIEELVSVSLDQVRVLEFILTAVKNGNSRVASVSDAIQQLTVAVVEGLEQSGAERLAAEEARREAQKDKAGPDKVGPAPEKKTADLGLLGGLAMLAKMAAEFIGGLVTTLTKAFTAVKNFLLKGIPKIFSLIKTIFTALKTFFVDLGSKISAFLKESKIFQSIKTFFVDLGSKISAFLKESKIFQSIKTFFVDLGSKISAIFTSAKTFFVDLGSKISAFFKESDLIKSITKVFTGESSIFSRIGSFFSNIGTKISAIFKESDLLGSIMKFFSGEGSILSKIGSFFGKFTSILGKIAVPITVIMGLFDGVSAAVDEFKKTGDIGKAIGEGVKGLVTSIVGAPLDLLKSAVSWILGKLGFGEAEEFLDSFSFSDIIGVFIQRVIDWGKGLFEKFFMTIYDVFTDISEGFSKGPLEGIMEIIRGLLKTLIAAPLDMVKNTLGSLAGLFGLSSVEESIRGFSFTKMLGGTNTETSADKPTSTKSVWAEAGEKTAARKLTAKKTAGERGVQAAKTAYEANSSGDAKMQLTPPTTGAEISAMQSNTADLEAAAQSSGGATVVAPQSRTVNNSSQSVTYNSNNIPDRTTWMMTPLASWMGA